MVGKSVCTTNPDTIRRWVEDRGGRPAVVKMRSTGGPDSPPRIEFPQYQRRGARNVQRVSWEEFFRRFEQRRLAFVYQEQTVGGATSRFFKFVSRDAPYLRAFETRDGRE
jgi:hypothetical protein